MEKNGLDSMKNQDLVELRNVTFSKDCREGAYSMAFDASLGSVAVIRQKGEMLEIYKDPNFCQNIHIERTFALWFKVNEVSNKHYLLKIGGSNGYDLYLHHHKLIADVTSCFAYHDLNLKHEHTLEAPYIPKKWNHVCSTF